jgi:hypothetical protein
MIPRRVQLLRDRHTAVCFSLSSRLPELSAGLVISPLSFPAQMSYEVSRASKLRPAIETTPPNALVDCRNTHAF